MRPKILVNVREIDMTTTVLGHPSSLPIYFTATALGKLAHKDWDLTISFNRRTIVGGPQKGA
eukprot:673103-Amphidinium_carterae.1